MKPHALEALTDDDLRAILSTEDGSYDSATLAAASAVLNRRPVPLVEPTREADIVSGNGFVWPKAWMDFVNGEPIRRPAAVRLNEDASIHWLVTVPTMQEVQQLVRRPFIESVTFEELGLALLVAGDGALLETHAENELASPFLWSLWAGARGVPQIAGPTVVVGLDSDGELCPLSDRVVEAVHGFHAQFKALA